MKRALRFAAAALLLPLLPMAAGAWVPIGGVWKNQNANLFIGNLEYWWAWNVSDAARDWNHKTAFTFDIQGNGIEACDRFDSNVMRPPNDQPPTNGVEFNETMCGNFPFDPAVLAVTHYLIDDQGYFEAAGIVFNKKDWEWAVYDGPWREDRADFHRVALHELGHFLGLDHEDAAPSIMHTYVSEIDELQPDDIEGANALYAVAGGGAGGAPALDPATACQVGQLKAASKLCKAQLGCEAKLARDPAKDPGGAQRDACQAKAAARFEAAWDGAVAEAAPAGGCANTDAAATVAPMVTDAAAGAVLQVGTGDVNDPNDRTLRTRLLKKSASLCGADLAAWKKNAVSANAAKVTRSLQKARARFEDAGGSAIAKATGRGVTYQGANLGTIADALESMAGNLATATSAP
jgi:Matrixin